MVTLVNMLHSGARAQHQTSEGCEFSTDEQVKAAQLAALDHFMVEARTQMRARREFHSSGVSAVSALLRTTVRDVYSTRSPVVSVHQRLEAWRVF